MSLHLNLSRTMHGFGFQYFTLHTDFHLQGRSKERKGMERKLTLATKKEKKAYYRKKLQNLFWNKWTTRNRIWSLKKHTILGYINIFLFQKYVLVTINSPYYEILPIRRKPYTINISYNELVFFQYYYVV